MRKYCPKIPCILVANKIDKPAEDRLISTSQGKKLA